tara:strand:- start:1199 stop:2008 length:810 start_codon:yes stop_codon:yes gene_type:complete
MHILSIDVGIKNLAHCLIKLNDNNEYEILLWDTINLSEGLLPKCHKPYCKDIAKFSDKNNCNYCNKHAKTTNLIIPDKNILKYKSLTIKELNEIIFKYNLYENIDIQNEKINKSVLTNNIKEFLDTKCLQMLDTSNISDISLIKLGIKIKEEYDKVFKDYKIDKVVIENQISPLANRMKALQAMITQYFIDRNICDIHYISSINKLKEYDKNNEVKTYNERKKFAIEIVKSLLESNNKIWIDNFNNNKKKDDMADTLLQVVYFIKNKCV